jgi:hypothetical protein
LLLAVHRHVAHIEVLRCLACILLHLPCVRVFLLALEALHVGYLALILLAINAIGNVLLRGFLIYLFLIIQIQNT